MGILLATQAVLVAVASIAVEAHPAILAIQTHAAQQGPLDKEEMEIHGKLELVITTMVEHQVEVAVIMVEEELLRAIVVAVQAAAVRRGLAH
jgi:hypothetical protein